MSIGDIKNLIALTEPLLALWHVTGEKCNGSWALPWAEITYLELDAGTVWLQSRLGVITQGMWWEESGLRLEPPFLVVQLQDGVTQAKITRFRAKANGPQRELGLCFHSGLELESSTY